MSERLQILKEGSQKRRQLLAQQYGLSSPDSLGDVLSGKQDQEEQALKRQDRALISPPIKRRSTDDSVVDTSRGIDPSKIVEDKAVEEEEEREEVYRDSTTFLKGTQSANPHNDYCQHFVDTGERPQNFIRDTGLANRFEEYPKLRELIRLKDELIVSTNIPPMYMKCDLDKFDLRDLDCKFDAILLEPPLEEYQRSVGLVRDKYWNWQEIERLEIEHITALRAFIWIWCGSSEGLDGARRCLRKWGFRRCEDICWIKTNSTDPGHNKNLETKSIFQRTKEHCLMGIKGTVRRSTDGDFIHANVDIDLIIEEEKPYGSDEKPVEIYHIIEHFCMGRRRLHIFGRDSTIRPGWLTVGPDVTSSNFDSETFNGYFNKNEEDYLTGCTEEVERLRPKSPPPKNKGGPNAGNQMGDGSMGGGPPRGHPRGGFRGGLGGRGGPSARGPPRGGPSRGGYGGRGWGGHKEGPPPR